MMLMMAAMAITITTALIIDIDIMMMAKVRLVINATPLLLKENGAQPLVFEQI